METQASVQSSKLPEAIKCYSNYRTHHSTQFPHSHTSDIQIIELNTTTITAESETRLGNVIRRRWTKKLEKFQWLFFFHFHCLDWISRKGTSRRVRCVINKFISKFNSFHLSFVGSWEMPTTIIIMMIVADKRHETCDDRFEVVNRHYDRFLLWSIFVSDKDEVVSLSEWQSESRQKINCGCHEILIPPVRT